MIEHVHLSENILIVVHLLSEFEQKDKQVQGLDEI